MTIGHINREVCMIHICFPDPIETREAIHRHLSACPPCLAMLDECLIQEIPHRDDLPLLRETFAQAHEGLEPDPDWIAMFEQHYAPHFETHEHLKIEWFLKDGEEADPVYQAVFDMDPGLMGYFSKHTDPDSAGILTIELHRLLDAEAIEAGVDAPPPSRAWIRASALRVLHHYHLHCAQEGKDQAQPHD